MSRSCFQTMEPIKPTPNVHTVPSWVVRSDDLQYCLYHPQCSSNPAARSPTESMRKGRYMCWKQNWKMGIARAHTHTQVWLCPGVGGRALHLCPVRDLETSNISINSLKGRCWQVPPPPEVLGRNLLLASSRFSAAGIAYPVATPYCPRGQHLQISLCSIFMLLCPLRSPNSLCLCYNNAQYCAKGPPG